VIVAIIRDGERMEAEMVSFETARKHYAIWRWKIERESSNRLVGLWAEIGASSLDDDTKAELANVAWALASFERAYNVLIEDIVRVESARNVGVPPAMKFLTGPYEDSLDYLLGMYLWMDLADVLVSYRTIVERFGHLRRPARRKRIPIPVTDIEREINVLRVRKLPEISGEPVTNLANTILHEAWHPSGARSLAFGLYWKGTNPMTLDFAEADFRGALDALVEMTIKQICEFILAVLQSYAAPNQSPEATLSTGTSSEPSGLS
jgi:hypothetical protein